MTKKSKDKEKAKKKETPLKINASFEETIGIIAQTNKIKPKK